MWFNYSQNIFELVVKFYLGEAVFFFSSHKLQFWPKNISFFHFNNSPHFWWKTNIFWQKHGPRKTPIETCIVCLTLAQINQILLYCYCSEVVKRANLWLSKHPEFRIQHCASIDTLVPSSSKSFKVNTVHSDMYLEKGRNIYIRSLRWAPSSTL